MISSSPHYGKTAFFVMVFVLLGVSLQAQKSEVSIKINEPVRDGINVTSVTAVKGTASIPSGCHLWILSRRIDFEDVWWPQGEGKIDPISQQWKVSVTFGQQSDIGWDFEIMAIIVNEEGNILLQNYRKSAMKSGIWNPIETPPSSYPPLIRKVTKIGHN